ncbi:mycofactocin biosynthesis glycosyltransferase MftF [Actinoallomurus spadix]|uniref:Mycofactocin biosynthesis glycosyltransferase MftF n=1 Tax=Actinoallomurus spadix TaxID=79912 RepID=A0ABN0VQY5_9ACTN|nr:mycofactocin biosynthesis glycosyltransferase MftF [Actinoallomurus spadix]MCO5990727.1 mycofactocin biosynthesis glycosyltransferase MftF [Actinoallomurus spadix]
MATAAEFRLTLDDGIVRMDEGRLLVRTRPLRTLRLSEEESRTLDRWTAGEAITDTGLARRLIDAGVAHPTWASGPFGPADVTVVIPVKDRAGLVAALVPTLGEVADVIVVDDGSRVPIDGARIRHERPRGPAAARNAGWGLAKTELVAFVDSDCSPSPGWLDALLPHFADPKVAAVAPRIASAPGGSLLERYETARSPHDLGRSPGQVRPRSPVGYVSTTVLVVRRSVLSEAGGLSEEMRFGEDLDLVFRLLKQGWKVRYEPASVATHLARRKPHQWVHQRFSYGTTDAPLLTRHPGSMAPLTASPWSVAAWALAGAGRLGLAATVAAGSALLTAHELGELRVPPRRALRVATAGHLSAGRGLVAALTRAWWPGTLAAMIASPRARRLIAATVLTTYADEWRDQRTTLGLVPWCLLRLADDVAYGTGIWAGCLRNRTFAPLIPDLHGAPGLQRRL